MVRKNLFAVVRDLQAVSNGHPNQHPKCDPHSNIELQPYAFSVLQCLIREVTKPLI
jgi:hypothetical protein